MGEPVGLAVEGQHRALDLLVVFELHLEQPHQLDADAGRAGDADQRVGVGRVHLLDVPAGDQIAHGGAAVAGHHDALGGRDGHDGGAVRGDVGGEPRRQRATARQQLGGGVGQELREGGRPRIGEHIWKTPGWIKTRCHVVPFRYVIASARSSGSSRNRPRPPLQLKHNIPRTQPVRRS